jgi:hypothetical protein
MAAKKKARRVLKVSTNTQAVTKSLKKTPVDKEIEAALRALIRKGRFVDVYK